MHFADNLWIGKVRAASFTCSNDGHSIARRDAMPPHRDICARIVCVLIHLMTSVVINLVVAASPAAVALLVGLAAAAMSYKTAGRTARDSFVHQRRLATDDRFWHKRASTHVEVLEWATPSQTELSADGAIAEFEAFAGGLELPPNLRAELRAFASEAVVEVAETFE
ncbi:hypothetical protein ACFWUU_05420 [Kribbella sp. NPDC058693]|uniref:hypothetical protein n=1 Tax=Kribbella sp. NPDC058693 TaxID=3346602 RepID=UPI00364786D9